MRATLPTPRTRTGERVGQPLAGLGPVGLGAGQSKYKISSWRSIWNQISQLSSSDRSGQRSPSALQASMISTIPSPAGDSARHSAQLPLPFSASAEASRDPSEYRYSRIVRAVSASGGSGAGSGANS